MRHVLLVLLTFCLLTRSTRAQDSTSNADTFVTAEVDNPSPFVGQQITYRVRFYDRTDVPNPLYEASDYEGFWRIDKHNSQQTTELRNGTTYKVTIVETALFPTHAGGLVIAPAKVLLTETVFRAQEELHSNSVMVQARSLPSGAPPGFSGAVGQFTLSASLDRSSAKVGEPIQLTLIVSGTGNVEQLPMPTVIPPDGWRVVRGPASYTVEEKNGVVVGSNAFRVSLVAGSAGTTTLPPILLHYFDPARMAYLTVQTSPITLVSTGDAPPTSADNRAGAGAVLIIKPGLTGTLGTFSGLLFWLLWLVPPAATVGVWGWQRRGQRRRRDAALMRKTNALKVAQARLKTAAGLPSREGCASVIMAIYGYFGDRTNRDVQSLTRDDLTRAMQPLPSTVQEAAFSCLDAAEEGRYAPSSAVDVRALVSRTGEALAAVDRAWGQP
jgi:hypothetical protein